MEFNFLWFIVFVIASFVFVFIFLPSVVRFFIVYSSIIKLHWLAYKLKRSENKEVNKVGKELSDILKGKDNDQD